MAISLAKGQKISLNKEAATLTNALMGLGWDQKAAEKPKSGGFFSSLFGGGSAASGKAIDLDASCVLLDAAGNEIDTVSFRQLRSRDGSIVHSGDNRTGAGDGDDERIQVNLAAVPPGVVSLVFTINSFSGQTFDAVANAYCRLVDARTNAEIARYNLSGGGPHTAQIMVRLHREGGDWKMHAIGEPASGRTVSDLLPRIRTLIS